MRIEDGAAIGREARCEKRAIAFGDEPLLAGADIVDEDARPVVQIAEIDDLLVIGRETRGERDRLAIGDEAVIGTVRIHDRQPLGAVILRAAFGDIGDAAVEEGAFAGQARIDGVGAFVRGAAPVRRLDDEALTGQLGLERDVVEIAADREIAVGIGADEALDQRLRAHARPVIELGGGDLGEADPAHRAGAERLEQPAAAKIGDDHFGDLTAERIGAAGGGGRDLRGRHGGDGDDEIIAAFVGDVDAELRGSGSRRSEKNGCDTGREAFQMVHCDSLLSNPIGLRSFQVS